MRALGLVRVLVDRDEEPGRHSVVWDGTDGRGRHVSSGVYFYRINLEDEVLMKKMMVIR